MSSNSTVFLQKTFKTSSDKNGERFTIRFVGIFFSFRWFTSRKGKFALCSVGAAWSACRSANWRARGRVSTSPIRRGPRSNLRIDGSVKWFPEEGAHGWQRLFRANFPQLPTWVPFQYSNLIACESINLPNLEFDQRASWTRRSMYEDIFIVFLFVEVAACRRQVLRTHARGLQSWFLRGQSRDMFSTHIAELASSHSEHLHWQKSGLTLSTALSARPQRSQKNVFSFSSQD